LEKRGKGKREEGQEKGDGVEIDRLIEANPGLNEQMHRIANFFVNGAVVICIYCNM